MTKKLVWRLGKLPTPLEVSDLVNHKIITNEEAKDILFSLETQEDRDKKSLEEEIKFLRALVEKLSNRSQIVEVIKEIHTPYWQRDWYRPYQYWCGSDNAINLVGSNMATLSVNTGSVSLMNNASNKSFSDIKTF